MLNKEVIPNNIQCSYCTRNYDRGGECKKPKYDDIGCMAFNYDTRGCIRNNMGTIIRIPIGYNGIKIGTWNDELYTTMVKVKKIKQYEFDMANGEMLIYCDIDYFVNEYKKQVEGANELKYKNSKIIEFNKIRKQQEE